MKDSGERKEKWYNGCMICEFDMRWMLGTALKGGKAMTPVILMNAVALCRV